MKTDQIISVGSILSNIEGDNVYMHRKILEKLIKDKTNALETQTIIKRKTFKDTVYALLKNKKNDLNHNNAKQQEEEKMKIAIVQFDEEKGDGGYDKFEKFCNDNPISITIEDYIDYTIDSVSLYNLELIGDTLIDVNINATAQDTKIMASEQQVKDVTEYFDANPICLLRYSDEELQSSNKIINNEDDSLDILNLKLQSSQSKAELSKRENNCSCIDATLIDQPVQRQTCKSNNPAITRSNLSLYGKHSLEFDPLYGNVSIVRERAESCLNNFSEVKIDYHNYAKLCLSESDITKISCLSNNTSIPKRCESEDFIHYTGKTKDPNRKRRPKKKKHKKRKRIREEEIEIQIIDPDDLPERARWTIMVTAFLLLIMCLFLVGLTLRMAPLIDDIVRQENERLKLQSMLAQNEIKNNSSKLI